MAKVKITGHASGTGVVTVTAPNTSTDRTITLPDSTDTLIGTATTDALTTRVNGAGGRKNMIINGAIQVSQRGDYTTAVSVANETYYQDRWTSVMNNGVAATIQTKSTDQPNGQTGNCIRVITSAGSSAAECVVDQRVENPQWLAGRTLTFSVWMKSNTNKAGISHYNNQDSFVAPTNHTGGGAWEKLTLTHTVNSTAPTDFRLRLGMSQSGNTVVGVGDYFEITEAQVELGSTATDFEHRSYGEELALCERYYGHYSFNIQGYPPTSGFAHANVHFRQTMRATPTFTQTAGATSNTNGNAANTDNITTKGFRIEHQTGGNNVRMYHIGGIAKLDAEL